MATRQTRNQVDFESILSMDRKFESILGKTRLERKNKDRTRLDSLESYVYLLCSLLNPKWFIKIVPSLA